MEKVTAKGGVSNGSTDLFAIRPDRFELTVDKAQKTGDSFYIIARAYDANKGTKTDVINFIKNYNLLLFAQPAECNLGTLTPQDVNFNAVVPYKGVYTYSEAGDVKFLLQESSGNEFAIVDAKDTPQDRRFITPSEVVVNFTPYQFQLKSSLKMNNGTFVYFSNDIPLDFGVSEGGHYSFELIAEGKPKGDEKYGTVVKNYRPNCMQTMKKVTIKFDSIMPSENLTKLNFALSQTNSTADSDKTDLQDSSSGSVELGIDHLTFATNYQDGDAIQRLSINFDRDSAHPINPLLFKPTQIILEDGKFVCVDCDNIPSAKFLYGRVYTPDIKTLENPYDKAQINYEVYCTLANCGDFFANSGTGGAQGWLVNEEQTTNLVKNITSLADTTAFKIDTKGYRVDSGKISNVSISSSVVPRAEVLRVDVPKYLVYDKYNKEMTNFYFIVEFYANSGASNWGGEGSVQKDKHNNVGNHIQTYPVRGSTRVRD